MDVGKRINQLRMKNNLTLDELASRTELTKGFLSQLERNLTSPSLQTLEDIASALGVTMERFFKEESDEQRVFKEEDYFIDEQDKVTIHWIVPNSQKNQMEPILLELKESGMSQEIRPHKGEEFGYVLSGEILLESPTLNSVEVVKKGECFYVKGNETYLLKNIKSKEAKVLWVSTPPIF